MEALSINADLCTACKACELACSMTKEGAFVPNLSRIRVVRFMDRGVNIPMTCWNCTNPPCLEACPTEALYMDRNVPVVLVNTEECINCDQCVRACPAGAIEIHPEERVAYKCDLCGGNPACIDSCQTGAISYRPRLSVAERKRRTVAEQFAAGVHGLDTGGR